MQFQRWMFELAKLPGSSSPLFRLCYYLLSSLEVHYCLAFTKGNRGPLKTIGMRKSPWNYQSPFCNCFQLNWSYQLLHLPYNLHSNKQGCHSLPCKFCSRLTPVCCAQRLHRPSVIFIELKKKSELLLNLSLPSPRSFQLWMSELKKRSAALTLLQGPLIQSEGPMQRFNLGSSSWHLGVRCWWKLSL